jgi:pyrimidine-nucleoside phosphorylase
MSQPLGRAVGNALEVREALDTLACAGPAEFTAFAVELAGLIVSLASDGKLGQADVEQALRSGAGLATLRRMIASQGGDTAGFDDRSHLPTARRQVPLSADAHGWIERLDALAVARASIALGAGRERKGDPIDLAVGIELQAKIGDAVHRGEPLAVLHVNDDRNLAQAQSLLAEAISISDQPVEPPAVILDRLTR